MIKLNYANDSGIDEVKIREITSLYQPLILRDIEIKITVCSDSVTAAIDCVLINVPLKEDSISKTAKSAAYLALKAYTGIPLPWGSLTGVKPLKKMVSLVESGISPQVAADFFSQTYDINADKISLLAETAANQLGYVNPAPDTVGLYIHIPLCLSKCTYCSFPSSVTSIGSDLCEQYLQALLIEISAVCEYINKRKNRIDCVYIGGGTPSILSEKQIIRLMDAILISAPQSTEITFEAGRSDTLSISKLRCLKECGVSRISLNPQTSNERTLKKINRGGSFSDFVDWYAEAVSAGFEHINCDLILGLPDETENDFYRSLNDVLNLKPSGITLHSLCAKRTAELSSDDVIPNPADVAYFHLKAHDMLKEKGYHPYYLYKQKNAASGSENTGYCLTGKECIYNIRMMGDKQTIFSAGANSSTKICKPDKNMYRTHYNVKDLRLYANHIEQIVQKKLDNIKNIENCLDS